ncbi:MAG: phenylalanine--tRNA ligase subunit beta [Gammaproteobacteria bacterium]
MKISESWLREWVDPDVDSSGLAHRLTMLGLEVDEVEQVAPPLEKVVVGEVEHVAQHPNADRLRVCRVGVGSAESLSIVCGAPNVRAGGWYPVALVGAVLPGGLKIRKSKLRGEVSAGMLCSGVELGISEDADGILELDGPLVAGTPVTQALDLDDCIIDLDLTPNRADCFSVLGVARDLAAGEGLAFSEPGTGSAAATSRSTLPVKLTAGAGCGRFVGRVIENFDQHAATPLWLRERLRRSGIRPVSPVVDVTNFVMLELGQPLHAYDLDELAGGIVVRRATDGEGLVLLDGREVTLDAETLVIADDRGAIGMAGIMGGASTAVADTTTNVFLEAAFFEPDVIAGRARRFGMHTDASVRFERGVDPEHQARAIERATQILLDFAGGEAGPLTEQRLDAHLPRTVPVRLRYSRLTAVLGHQIAAAEVETLLAGLSMTVVADGNEWLVTPPPARFDIHLEEDLIEEVVRLYGYDRIPKNPGGLRTTLGRHSERQVPVERVRTTLVARGYQEAMTYSFVKDGQGQLFGAERSGPRLANPISAELAVMRQSLWPGLVQALRHNLNRQQARVRLFEIGTRFLQQDTDIIEENMISGLIAGGAYPEHWDTAARPADFFDLKADLEALFALSGSGASFDFVAATHPVLRPGRSARVVRAGETVGWCGELHPSLTRKQQLNETPILFEFSFEPVFAARVTEYSGISKFPAVRRDIAVVVDQDVPVARLEESIRAAAGESLREVVVFDIFVGKNIETGSKSVALGLILKETSSTLKDADVEAIVQSVKRRLARDFNATIRE